MELKQAAAVGVHVQRSLMRQPNRLGVCGRAGPRKGVVSPAVCQLQAAPGRAALGSARRAVGSTASRGASAVCRAALPTSVSEAAAAVLSVCNLDGLAALVGWVMGAGSLFLFAPIFLRMIRKKSAAGLSVVTWVLQMAAFSGSTLYNASRGHPLSTYSEACILKKLSNVTCLVAAEPSLFFYAVCFPGRAECRHFGYGAAPRLLSQKV